MLSFVQGPLVQIEVEGSGFLYRQVRNMVIIFVTSIFSVKSPLSDYFIYLFILLMLVAKMALLVESRLPGSRDISL